MRWWFAIVLVAFCASGCAGYRLGPTNSVSAGSRSVQVNLFQNETIEPRVIEAVGTALRRRIQLDGTYRLNTHGDGDIVVSGAITDFRRASLSFEPQDLATVRDVELRVTAHVTAVDRANGKTLLDREVFARTTVRQGNDLASAERQAMPLLAEDLARNITSLLVDGTW